MMAQSELPFRMLCRAHGAEAAYTPMLHARLFLEHEKYRCERQHTRTAAAGAGPSTPACDLQGRQPFHPLLPTRTHTLSRTRDEHFTTCEGDRPLFVQFCANDPDVFVRAASMVQVCGRACVCRWCASLAAAAGALCPPPPHHPPTHPPRPHPLTRQAQADYIDLNLGCPQRIAKRGYYGAFLMDDLGRVADIVAAGASRLAVPVSVKIRLFPDLQVH
jgi:tRNA-dihydrouridine synthase 1